MVYDCAGDVVMAPDQASLPPRPAGPVGGAQTHWLCSRASGSHLPLCLL